MADRLTLEKEIALACRVLARQARCIAAAAFPLDETCHRPVSDGALQLESRMHRGAE